MGFLQTTWYYPKISLFTWCLGLFFSRCMMILGTWTHNMSNLKGFPGRPGIPVFHGRNQRFQCSESLQGLTSESSPISNGIPRINFLFHSFDDRLSKLDPKTGRLVCHTKSERPIYMHADIVFVKKKLPPYPRIKLSMGKSSLG